MKIGIVGGTGNISLSFSRLLVELGHEVVCFNRGRMAEAPAGVRVILGDRTQREEFEAIIQAERFDAAIDMICFTREDAESSLRAFRGVGHFVMCSTVCTYGIDYDWLPVTEDHPLRPISDYGRGKVAADDVFLSAYHSEGFPVTIIKPSTTYGWRMGLLRQVSVGFGFIDRIRKGKAIVVCGDGSALHQFLHVEDAALCFAHVVGKEHCVGQTYNMVRRGFTTWAEYHRTVMRVIGNEVELVGVPLAALRSANVPDMGRCESIFGHHTIYGAEKLRRDVPEFQPRISLEEGIRRNLDILDREDRIPNSDGIDWEDRIIEAQRKVGELNLA